MTEIIFTSRPVSWKPLSWVNLITRAVTRSPFDHVALKREGYIYESTAGKGVHKIKYDEWTKGREGTYLFVYNVDDGLFDMDIFYNLEGRGYDYMANIYYLLGMKSLLKRKPNKKIYCSELIAHLFRFQFPYKWTPDDIELEIRDFDMYITEL